jgi:hypothetical protein
VLLAETPDASAAASTPPVQPGFLRHTVKLGRPSPRRDGLAPVLHHEAEEALGQPVLVRRLARGSARRSVEELRAAIEQLL